MTMTTSFPLSIITQEEAMHDGVDLFAARSAVFGNMMESTYEHYLLKKDLVQHIKSLNQYLLILLFYLLSLLYLFIPLMIERGKQTIIAVLL
jgi:hypothetical protein